MLPINVFGGQMHIQSMGNLGERKLSIEKTNNLNTQQSFGLVLKPAQDVDTFNGKPVLTTVSKQSFLSEMISFLGKQKNSKRGNSRRSNKSNRYQKRHNNHNKTQHRSHTKSRKTQKNDDYVRPVFEYKNKFSERLQAEPNNHLKALLACDDSVRNVKKANQRISSLSRYLKEDMVGFITPDGVHWFEKALPFIYKGCVAKDIGEEKYFDMAISFWSLMAKADNYWKSPEFVDYLKTMERTPAVKATIEAVKGLMANEDALQMVAFTGYPSKIKYIPDLNKCAYSARSLKWDTDALHNPSAEHILPHSIAGDEVNIDINYLVTSAQANSERGNIPLIAYLKGWDAEDYALVDHNKKFFSKLYQ